MYLVSVFSANDGIEIDKQLLNDKSFSSWISTLLPLRTMIRKWLLHKRNFHFNPSTTVGDIKFILAFYWSYIHVIMYVGPTFVDLRHYSAGSVSNIGLEPTEAIGLVGSVNIALYWEPLAVLMSPSWWCCHDSIFHDVFYEVFYSFKWWCVRPTLQYLLLLISEIFKVLEPMFYWISK